MKDNISKAQKKYRDSKTYQVNLRFLLDKDKDVIAEVQRHNGNKPDYFRKLIRDSIKRRKAK